VRGGYRRMRVGKALIETGLNYCESRGYEELIARMTGNNMAGGNVFVDYGFQVARTVEGVRFTGFEVLVMRKEYK